jgi:hypothetical protein
MHTPGVHVIVAVLVETLEAFGLCVNRTAICVQNDGLRRGGADHVRAPPAMGRAPGGPAGVAAIVSEPAGVEAPLGVRESAAGRGTGPREIPNGFIVNRGDINHGESTRARPPGPWHGVPAVRVDAIAGLLGNE